MTTSAADTAEEQHSLILPNEWPRPVPMYMSTDRLPETFRRTASPAMVRIVRNTGCRFSSLVVIDTEDGEGAVEIADGNKRGDAARKAGLDEVPVLLFPFGTSKHMARIIALETNVQRSPNVVTELEAIEDLLPAVGNDPKALAVELEIPLGTVKKRMKLLRLRPKLRERLTSGELAAGLAEDVAMLPPIVQDQLAELEHITGDDVVKAKAARAQSAAQALALVAADPGPEAEAWNRAMMDPVERTNTRRDFLSMLDAARNVCPEDVHPRVRMLLEMAINAATWEAHGQFPAVFAAPLPGPTLTELAELPELTTEVIQVAANLDEPAAVGPGPDALQLPAGAEDMIGWLVGVPVTDPNFKATLVMASRPVLDEALRRMRANPAGKHKSRIEAVERQVRKITHQRPEGWPHVGPAEVPAGYTPGDYELVVALRDRAVTTEVFKVALAEAPAHVLRAVISELAGSDARDAQRRRREITARLLDVEDGR